MLKKLTVQNYALIDNLNFEFPNGLIIITGETGAGKSILLGALSLLLGGKADVTFLKDNSKNCVVEGEFIYNEQELILRRVISPSGRSRNFINDEPASLADLTAISSKIIDIHAQHQHLLLMDANYQMSILDHFAGAIPLLNKYKEAYALVLQLEGELTKLDAEIKKCNSERDYKQFQFDKLNEAKLVEGELESLESEQKQLANAEQIKSYIVQANELFNPMGVSIVQNFKEASHILQKCSNFVPELGELAQRLESCRIECKDIQQDIENKLDEVVVSPDRLQSVEDRIGEIYSLLRKHSVENVAELIAVKDSLESELAIADSFDSKREQLLLTIDNATKKRDDFAKLLSEKRRENVKKLSKNLQDRIRDLKMPYAVLEVSISEAEGYKQLGKDKIEFLFSANGDENLSLLQKVASGGELSRIMLCIKSLMAEFTGMPTMIFDEIDTGVSGSIADKMGRLIGKMGEKMQIFAITHLPQIASQGGTHLLVYKEFDNNKAKTNIKEISGKARIEEVARMLSGSELTDAAIDNAKVLLNMK